MFHNNYYFFNINISSIKNTKLFQVELTALPIINHIAIKLFFTLTNKNLEIREIQRKSHDSIEGMEKCE